MPTTGWSSCGVRRARCSQGVLDLGRGGTFQSRTERDIVVRTSLARLEQLDIGDQALTFGRIDRLPRARRDGAATGPALGETFHIGRLAIHGPGPRAAGGRLAGPGGRALLPGHRAWTRRASSSGGTWRCGAARWSASRTSGSCARAAAGHLAARGRTATTAGDDCGELIVRGDLALGGPARPAGRTRPGPVRSDDRHRLHDPGRAGRDHPGPVEPGCWWSRAARGRARRRWPCTGPRTCSTPTGSPSSARACWWWARTRCSCATSNRCCPRWGRPG